MRILNHTAVAVVIALVSACGGGSSSDTTTTTTTGIGGTGITFGPVTGFGSVIVNGVEYDTSLADFSVEDSSTGIDQSDLGVGMVVTVTHDDSDVAKSIDYKDNAEGPVANKVDIDGVNGTFDVLGVTVTVDGLTVYDGTTGITAIANDDIVEVSGHITGENAVLATRVEKKGTCSSLAVGEEIEVKGTITLINSPNEFTIGTLTVNYASGVAPVVLAQGDYVEVKSDTCPAGVPLTLTATEISLEDEGPDLSDLDAGEDGMEIKGVVAGAAGSAPSCTFSVNGQPVSTNSGTAIEGNLSCDTLVDGDTVEVQGQLVAGVLVATEISNEDAGEDVVGSGETGVVSVTSQTSAFEGIIAVNGIADITVNLTTIFEGQLQSFDLDTIAASTTPVCAEVILDSANKALLIHEEECN